MRALIHGVLGLFALLPLAAPADTGPSVPLERHGLGDGGAERVLARLRDLPAHERARSALSAGRDADAPVTSFAEPEATGRPFQLVTTRPLGSPSVLFRDRGRITALWEGPLRTRTGKPRGVELTTIREADALDPTGVGIRMF